MSYLGVSNEAPEGHIPPSVLWSFAIGALVFMISILWSIFSTTEEPPADLEAFRKENAESKGFFKGITEIASNFKHMPTLMWKLGVVQFFSWFAFFTMWSFATPALTEHVYHAAMPQHGDADFDAKNQLYNQAANSVGSSMGMYGLSSMAFALLLTLVTAKKGINRRLIHMLSLLAGGLGFLLMTKANGPVPNNDPDSFVYMTNDGILNLAFALIGISWGSILSMPYAILSSAVKPEKMGISMGIFNMFIVIPQIVAALGGINWAYKTILGHDIINTMVLAGIALILGALSTFMLPKQQ
jgi:maltose/moltooligosaccharide transporter